MSIKDKISQFFFLEEDDADYEEFQKERPVKNEAATRQTALPSHSQRPVNRKETVPQARRVNQSESNVVSINQRQAQKPKIKVVEPRTYSEVREIADLILKNYSVILNFRRMEKDPARKVLDFLMGTVYAVDGDIQRIGEEIFVCTPSNVEIDGTELETFKSNEY